MTTIADIRGLVNQHEQWRRMCLNLIASENSCSPAVRQFWDSDLVQRYGNYLGRDLRDRRYTGSHFVQEIELALEKVVRDTFGASEVELRAISGHVAGLAIIMAVCHSGDTVFELSSACGGHGLAVKAAKSALIDLKVEDIPFDSYAYNINVDALRQKIEEHHPRLIFLGSSNFLFPNPVREIAAICQAYPETIIAYDASHVMGLIACGEFQNPLAEGAHVVFGSTHKTLPGPQGGLIYGNDPQLMDLISIAVYPGIVTNHHLMRSPSLAVALLEMSKYPNYARAVVENAQALGVGLHQRGIPVVAYDKGVTQSHTVIMNTSKLGKGAEIAEALEAANIMSSYTRLPEELGSSAIRFGSQEVTRCGATPKDMDVAAEIIVGVLDKTISQKDAQSRIAEWVTNLNGQKYLDEDS